MRYSEESGKKEKRSRIGIILIVLSGLLMVTAIAISITSAVVCRNRISEEKEKEEAQLSDLDEALYSTAYIDDTLMKVVSHSVRTVIYDIDEYNGTEDFAGCSSIAKAESYELCIPDDPDSVRGYYCYLDENDYAARRNSLCALTKDEWFGDPPLFYPLDISDNVITCDFDDFNVAIVICSVYGSIEIYHAVLVK